MHPKIVGKVYAKVHTSGDFLIWADTLLRRKEIISRLLVECSAAIVVGSRRRAPEVKAQQASLMSLLTTGA
jgi:hypothetical protein